MNTNTVFVGLRFNGKHSYSDYGLTLISADFGQPAPKTRFVDIPGADGVLDLTATVGGTVRYGNRAQMFVFKVRADDQTRQAIKDELTNDLHGRDVIVIPDTDPERYYEGRATVTFDNIEDWKMNVNIAVDAKPYKLEHDMTVLQIAAESFDQQDIYVGQGSARQAGFSGFYDVGNVSNMAKLVLAWDETCPKVGPLTLTISDGTNSYATSDFDYEDYGIEVPVSALSALDTTAITRVVLTGIRLAKLYKRTNAGALLTVENDRMPVCPYWENPNSGSIIIFVNGKQFTLATGETQNPDIVLDPGENQIALTSASVPTDPIILRFRKGRL